MYIIIILAGDVVIFIRIGFHLNQEVYHFLMQPLIFFNDLLNYVKNSASIRTFTSNYWFER